MRLTCACDGGREKRHYVWARTQRHAKQRNGTSAPRTQAEDTHTSNTPESELLLLLESSPLLESPPSAPCMCSQSRRLNMAQCVCLSERPAGLGWALLHERLARSIVHSAWRRGVCLCVGRLEELVVLALFATTEISVLQLCDCGARKSARCLLLCGPMHKARGGGAKTAARKRRRRRRLTGGARSILDSNRETRNITE